VLRVPRHGLEAPVAYLQNYTTFNECIVDRATRWLRSEPYGEQVLRLKNPTGFEQPSVNDSSFVEGFAPFTNAVGAQSPGVGCPLIGATYFPVFGTVDLRKTIYLPSGASNVTAYVAIDNDFTCGSTVR
jgi:hypothetical protein